MRNKYCHRSKLSEAKFHALVKCFATDLTAVQTAQMTGLNRNTVNRFYRALRERIHTACEAQRPIFGVVEVDESLFGARRVKGKRGRGACGKTTVFGIFERNGQVYTEVVPDCKMKTLQGIIRGHVDPDAVINSDGWRGYIAKWVYFDHVLSVPFSYKSLYGREIGRKNRDHFLLLSL
jgi:transposase